MPEVDGGELHVKAGKDQEEERRPGGKAPVSREEGGEQHPEGDRAQPAPEDAEELPLPGGGTQEGSGEGHDLPVKGTVGGKIARQPLRPRGFGDPQEPPVVPIKTHPSDIEPVGKEGDEQQQARDGQPPRDGFEPVPVLNGHPYAFALTRDLASSTAARASPL